MEIEKIIQKYFKDKENIEKQRVVRWLKELIGYRKAMNKIFDFAFDDKNNYIEEGFWEGVAFTTKIINEEIRRQF